MTLRGRLSTVVRGKLDALLSRLEDPGEALEYAFQLLLERLAEARRAVADVGSALRGLEDAGGRLTEAGQRLRSSAEEAVATGSDEVAREALARWRVLTAGAEAVNAETRSLAEDEARFSGELQRLSDRVGALGGQREALKLASHDEAKRASVDVTAAALREEAERVRLAARRAEANVAARRGQLRRLDSLLASGELYDLSTTPSLIERDLRRVRGSADIERAMSMLTSERPSAADREERRP